MAGQPQLVYTSPDVVDATDRTGIDAYKLEISQATGAAPVEIIDTGKDWKVTLKFRIGGSAASFIVATPGKAAVNFYYEGQGGAPEGTLNGTTPISVDITTGVLNATSLAYEYSASYTVSGASTTLMPGLYRLSASVVFPDTGTTWGLGFIEGPLVQKN